jgi:hypothetical protein
MESKKFSKRLGIIPVSKSIQKDFMDDALAIGLYNAYYTKMIKEWNPNSRNTPYQYDQWAEYTWKDFLEYAMDDFPTYPSELLEIVKKQFFKNNWFYKYDFIQFNADVLKNIGSNYLSDYIMECNRILEKESSAYRFIKTELSPIINEIEINSIEQSLSYNLYPNVSTHLDTALKMLSDRKSPDYRNSIKESISAVETLCRELTGESTLGQAIKKFENSGIHFNSQFKSALEKLYNYTNQPATGIRHALMEEGIVLSFDEAKFMLVSCSAFINYLISKKIQQ